MACPYPQITIPLPACQAGGPVWKAKENAQRLHQDPCLLAGQVNQFGSRVRNLRSCLASRGLARVHEINVVGRRMRDFAPQPDWRRLRLVRDADKSVGDAKLPVYRPAQGVSVAAWRLEFTVTKNFS